MTTSLLGRSTGFTTGGKSAGPVQRVRRIIEYRRILALLVGRDLKIRYAGSTLGYLWSILDPLLMSLVYWFVFTEIIKRNVGYDPYILFLLTGQLPWFWISNSINGTVAALRSESQMVRSSNVPREVWILRVILSKGSEYVFSLPVLALFALIYLKAPDWHLVFLPLALLMAVVLLTGVGLILAPLSVLVPDIRRVMRVVTRVLFYISPTLYSIHNLNRVPGALQTVLSWNPIAGILCLSRAAFFPQELDWSFVIHSVFGCVLFLAVGMYVFNRLERPMLKEI